MASLQPDGPHRRLAGRAAVLGHFEAVVQRVADQMVERCLEPIEDVAVDAGGLTGDLEPGLLAELSGQVADQPREAADAVGQRPHPAGQNFMVQPAGKVFAPAGELLDRLDRLAQPLQALGGLSLGLGQPLALGGGQRVLPARHAVFQDLQRFQKSRLLPLEPPERVDQRREPVGLHQGLARQTHQPRQALGRHPHDPVVFSIPFASWPAPPGRLVLVTGGIAGQPTGAAASTTVDVSRRR